MLRNARLVAVAMGLLFCAGRALAQSAPLDEALRAYADGRLDEAPGRFEAALAAPGNGPAALATIHLHLGILHASLGDATRARRDFELALALRPDSAPPSELGPGQRAAFDDARAAREGHTMRIEGRARGHGAVEARVVDAPDGLVAGIVVHAALPSENEWTGRIAGTSGTTALPRGARDVVVQAVDEHGGIVAQASVTASPVAPDAGDTARRAAAAEGSRASDRSHETLGSREDVRDRDTDGGGFFSTAWPWIGLGAVVVGAAIAVLLVATARDEYTVSAPVFR